MTDKQTPPDWVLTEAAKRCGEHWPEYHDASYVYRTDPPFRALCDMIERYEARPVDRKLLCAREAFRQISSGTVTWDEDDLMVRAIELWEEGFGK